jgi:hypothetical protein
MKGLILAPQHNDPSRGRGRDASGEFQVKARDFARIHSLRPPILFNNNSQGHRAPGGTLLAEIRSAEGPLDVFAYFGHGVPEQLSSFDNMGPIAVPSLARALLENGRSGILALFYACAAGRRGGFLESLSRILGPNAVIYGHTDYGPASSNPRVIRYPGGTFVIDPSDSLWPAWTKALKTTDLWARFPFLPDAQIRAELTKVPPSRDR